MTVPDGDAVETATRALMREHARDLLAERDADVVKLNYGLHRMVRMQVWRKKGGKVEGVEDGE